MKAIVQQYNSGSGKCVLLTAIRFEELLGKAEITYKTESDDNPYDDWDGTGAKDLYQRKLELERVRSISEYIRKSVVSDHGSSRVEKPLFPNSMILAIKGEDVLPSSTGEIVDLDWGGVDTVYIVDGQHRFAGMRRIFNQLQGRSLMQEANDEKLLSFIKQYRFNCTVLINYDLWEQAEIFADINFKQKRVNKSLYYEIYGQYPPEREEDYERSFIFLAHNLVNVLNYHDLSPMKGMIKMLGTGSGTISQAYLVEAIARHIQPDKAIWHYNPFDDGFSPQTYMHMAVELLSFFTAVKKLFPEYWGNSRSILSKTSGLGAMIRLLKDVHDRLPQSLKRQLRSYSGVSLDNDYIDSAGKYMSPLKPYGDKFFGVNSQYAGGGGAGNVGKMYKDMLYIINQDEISLF